MNSEFAENHNGGGRDLWSERGRESYYEAKKQVQASDRKIIITAVGYQLFFFASHKLLINKT